MNKKALIGTTIAVSLLISGTALAGGFTNPRDLVSNLTKLPAEKVYEQRAEGKTYGQIASENGVLDQFKNEMVEYKKSIIEQRVKEGTLSQENADAFVKALEERVADCDGTPDADRERLGQKFGGGMGFGRGTGMGMGQGRGQGMGRGMGFGGGTGK